jgi:hypothetical protein
MNQPRNLITLSYKMVIGILDDIGAWNVVSDYLVLSFIPV